MIRDVSGLRVRLSRHCLLSYKQKYSVTQYTLFIYKPEITVKDRVSRILGTLNDRKHTITIWTIPTGSTEVPRPTSGLLG